MPTSPPSVSGVTENSSDGVCSPTNISGGSSAILDLGEGTEDPVLQLKRELKELDKERAKMEAKVFEALGFLKDMGVGMNASLIDEEGFPRNDVDVYAVRGARNTVARGQNDLKSLTNLLQIKLEELHALTEEDVRRSEGFLKEPTRPGGPSALDRSKVSVVPVAEVAAPTAADCPGFLQVDAVAPGGPGYQCGLRVGDRIHRIGGTGPEDQITKATYTGMQQLAEYIGAREGAMVPLLVSSPEISDVLLIEQFLVPQRWEGRGLMGATFTEV